MSHAESKAAPAELELIDLIENKLNLSVKCQVLASSLTTFAIGGPIRFLVEPQSIIQLQELIKLFTANQQIYKLLGAGSNLLIADQGVNFWVIKLGRGFRTLEPINDGKFRVGASYSLMSLSRELSQAGYSGLEFSGGIPASLGGAVYMNAGAHGSEICSVLENISIINSTGELEELAAKKLTWSYRKSNLPIGSIVVGANFKLTVSSIEQTSKKRAECLEYRKKTQPLTMPSAGSIFKNPSHDQSAGYLIEQSGLKGYQHGAAMISELHANWIINPKRLAKATDVVELIDLCKSRVLEKFAIELQPEIVRW